MPTATEGEREEVPLSYEQEQLWFSHQLMPNATLDHECVMVAFPAGNLDAVALRQSLDAFVQRHEIWRTTFQPHGAHGGGGPCRWGGPKASSAGRSWIWLTGWIWLPGPPLRLRRCNPREQRRSSPLT